MKIILGIKIGGLQQKIFNLVQIFILALVGIYVAVFFWQQKNLTGIVEETGEKQQASIASVFEETMEAVLDASMSRNTALQAYIADDLFSNVRTDVLTLQAFATGLFENVDSFSMRPVYPPDKANNGKASVQMLHEEGVDPDASETLGLVANMSEIVLAMFENSDKLSGCFVATTDGNLMFVNDRSGAYVSADGTPLDLDVRQRPWYKQAVKAGELIFTGMETDAYTGIPTLECAAPVYRDGELVAVVGADIFLTSISDYVKDTATEGSFVCVVSGNGQVLFSPEEDGIFVADLSESAPDLRENENKELAGFVTCALRESTGVQQITVDGKEYYMSGAPLATVGWATLSVTDKEVTCQPAATIQERYDDINDNAFSLYEMGAKHSMQTILVLTGIIILIAIIGALVVAQRIVKPLERMTKRINALKGGNVVFEMEDTYRTDDEIEILAEAFATLSKRTQKYIAQITKITAEKERIGTELALATRIQADMLPNLYPAFPERSEFDIYATMTPAKEVGGDFYDFFLIDDDHLYMVMADVSGKGVPAALFMMASKIILANNAMLGKSPAMILEDTNAAICANNREEMFVTVWIGILEISTGKLIAANAGHEYPVLMQQDCEFTLFKDRHGFVIGGMDGMRYKEYELALTPGAKLFVYTDGVPEATDANEEMFGINRMLEALNADVDAAPEQILKNVRKAVDEFVKDAEQFDDLTMLCMEYRGK